jgi:putative methyltransferase (TIGR04325 family)
VDFEYLGSQWPHPDLQDHDWRHFAELMVLAMPEFFRIALSSEPLAGPPLAPFAHSESHHNTTMTFAYVLARAAHGKTQLTMLDWGGALGHYGIMASRLLPEVSLALTIKERPEMCEIGRTLLPWVQFEATDEACFARTYDLVMASGSLQYAEDWRTILSRLVKAARPWLFVARLPVVESASSFVIRQREKIEDRQIDHLSWAINRHELLEEANAVGAKLEREFIAGQSLKIEGAPEEIAGKGFLFRC